MLFRSPRHLACIGSFHIVHSLAALYKQKKWLAPVSLYINTCFLRNHCRKLLSKVCTVCRHEIYAALTLFDISKQQIVRRNHVLARTTPACVCINNYDESGSENYSHVSHRQLLCKSIGWGVHFNRYASQLLTVQLRSCHHNLVPLLSTL